MLAVRLAEARSREPARRGCRLAAVNSPKLVCCLGPGARRSTVCSRAGAKRGGGAAPCHQPRVSFPDDGSDHRAVHRVPRAIPLRRARDAVHLRRERHSGSRAEEATDPAYWARHFREPVRFSAGVASCVPHRSDVFLEVGRARTLCTLVRQHREGSAEPRCRGLACRTSADEPIGWLSILGAAGRLWLRGSTLNWAEMHEVEPRRCSLPTYPFERKRYWIDPPRRAKPVPLAETGAGRYRQVSH